MFNSHIKQIDMRKLCRKNVQRKITLNVSANALKLFIRLCICSYSTSTDRTELFQVCFFVMTEMQWRRVGEINFSTKILIALLDFRKWEFSYGCVHKNFETEFHSDSNLIYHSESF